MQKGSGIRLKKRKKTDKIRGAQGLHIPCVSLAVLQNKEYDDTEVECCGKKQDARGGLISLKNIEKTNKSNDLTADGASASPAIQYNFTQNGIEKGTAYTC